MSEQSFAPLSERQFIFLLASLMSVVAITIDALLPALGIVSRDLQVANTNHVQLLIGSVFAGLAVGQLVCGPFSDALGRRRVLFAGLTLYSLGSAFCYVAPTLPWLIAGRVIQGLGAAGPYISTISIVRDRYKGREMARLMSLVTIIFILVPAIAPTLGQAILHIATWREIFLLYIVYASLVGGWIYFRLEETLPPENRVPFTLGSLRHGLSEILRNKATVCYTLAMGLCFGSFFGYLNSSQQIFQVQFGVGELFTVYFGALALTLGCASLLNSRLVIRFGMHYLSLRSILVIVVLSAIFIAMHWLVEVRLWMFVTYAACLFFCFGLTFGNLNAMAMEPMGHIAGLASAIIGCSSSVLSLFLGGILGQLYDNTLIPIVAGFLILDTIVLVLLLIAQRHRQPATTS